MSLTYAERATKYAEDVVAGAVVACRLVRLACERHLRDLERDDIVFDHAAANRYCFFVEQMPHHKGRWASRGERIKLEDWQCFSEASLFGWLRVSDGLRRFRESYEEIARKNGKALCLNTEVPTPTGFVRMGDIVVGDRVFAADGSVTTVTATSDVFYDHRCYRVQFSTGESVVADAGHLWVTDARAERERVSGVPRAKTTEEIAGSIDYGSGRRVERNHRVALVSSPVEGCHAELPIDPYVLGVWLGDGARASGRISNPDCEVWSEIERRGFRLGKKRWRGGCYLATVLGLSRSLSDLGLGKEKFVPDQYLLASVQQRRELLCGLMDTDGTISPKGQAVFTSIDRALVDAVSSLAASLGYKPSIRSARARLNGKDCGKYYEVQFWPTASNPVFFVRRKAERQRASAGARCLWRQIVSVEPVESRPVKCITVDHPSHQFLVTRSFLPTHNSTKEAACGNYMAFADGEFGAEVYSGATSIKQALEVFGPARVMMERAPEIRERFGIEIQNQQLLVRKKDGSKFEPIIAKPGDGSSPYCVIIDEYHEHKTDEQYESMQTGMGARAMGGAPLLRVITTAGTQIGGPCHKMRQKAERVLEGQEKDDQFFALVYTVDREEEWTTAEGLLKANPNIDVSVSREYLEKQVQSALQDPSKQSMVKRKHFNVWTTAADQWMDMEAWKAAEDTTLRQEDFEGCPVQFSIDLSSSDDLAGYAKVFERDGTYYSIAPRFYLPEDTVNREDNSHYQGWAASGHLTVTPDAAIDESYILHDLVEDMQACGVRHVGVDPWQARNLSHALEKEGATAVEVQQNFQTMSRPMQQVAALVREGRFKHDGNPIMSWNMANVTAQWNPDGRYCRPKKGGDQRQKIDGATMVISSMALFDVAPPEKKRSKYESEGVRVLGG